MLTKRQAITIFETRQKLADALGLKSVSTISMWGGGGDDALVPEVHELRIRYELRPDAFDADGNLIAQDKAA